MSALHLPQADFVFGRVVAGGRAGGDRLWSCRLCQPFGPRLGINASLTVGIVEECSLKGV